MAKGEASGGVGRATVVGVRVLPRVDEETVEAAEGGEEECCRKKRKAKIGTASDGGDKDGGGEEDADGDLLG